MFCTTAFLSLGPRGIPWLLHALLYCQEIWLEGIWTLYSACTEFKHAVLFPCSAKWFSVQNLGLWLGEHVPGRGGQLRNTWLQTTIFLLSLSPRIAVSLEHPQGWFKLHPAAWPPSNGKGPSQRSATSAPLPNPWAGSGHPQGLQALLFLQTHCCSPRTKAARVSPAR